jgi:DNA-binding response OmpR family regulator
MNQRILVVDDDKHIVRLVRAYLEQAGFQVFTAYDGGTALHVIRRERPDLVVPRPDAARPGRLGPHPHRAV